MDFKDNKLKDYELIRQRTFFKQNTLCIQRNEEGRKRATGSQLLQWAADIYTDSTPPHSSGLVRVRQICTFI